MASAIHPNLSDTGRLNLVLASVLAHRPLSTLVGRGLTPTDVASALTGLRALGYLELSDKGLMVTQAGRKMIRNSADDPADPWLSVPEEFLLAPNERDGIPRIGRRDRVAIRKRVSDQTG